VLLVGLQQLGQRTLSLGTFPRDPSLGLGTVGQLAFTAFRIHAAGFAPVLIVSVANPVRLVMNLGLFMLGVVAFFASLQGLHRQMVTARRSNLEWAKELYASAYEPVRSGSLDALRKQLRLLAAAEAIERRAAAIQQWPFENHRLSQIAAIIGTMVTFVITGILTRLILVWFGL
jgi:hypothetical protein